jgi:hypothetical protein
MMEVQAVDEKIVKDFGSECGTEVANKDTILSELDAACGVDGPPAVEFFFVQPWASFRVPFTNFGIAYNSYGHAALRYTMPDGEQKVVNIANSREGMVFWSTPSAYLFATNWDMGCQQKGLYNRDIIGLRIEKLPPESLLAMDKYFCELAARSVESKAKYHLWLDFIVNRITKMLGFELAERGNCARYTSKGLLKANLVTKTSMWPKSIWINLFENFHRTATKEKKNMHVISYRRIKHAKQSYGVDASAWTAVAPLHALRTYLYFDLEKFADFIVEVPRGELSATIRKNKNPKRQSHLRNFLLNSQVFIGASVLVTAHFLLSRARALYGVLVRPMLL